MAVEITDANFEELVNGSDKPVLLDFGQNGADHAVWSVPTLKKSPRNLKGKLWSEK